MRIIDIKEKNDFILKERNDSIDFSIEAVINLFKTIKKRLISYKDIINYIIKQIKSIIDIRKNINLKNL